MIAEPRKRPPAQLDYSKFRHPPLSSDLQLSAESEALLASIDAAVRPVRLAAAFPRIVNRIAVLWRTPRNMDRYFDDLLVDTRGNRKGFPLEILTELITLKDHYQTKVFPAIRRGDLWDVGDRIRRDS